MERFLTRRENVRSPTPTWRTATTRPGNCSEQTVPSGVELSSLKDWKVLGVPTLRPNAREIVTGAHQYPSDVARPGMLYAKILRAPSLNTKLLSIDLAPAKAMPGVVVVQDDQFVGVAAPIPRSQKPPLNKISGPAMWDAVPQPSIQ